MVHATISNLVMPLDFPSIFVIDFQIRSGHQAVEKATQFCYFIYLFHFPLAIFCGIINRVFDLIKEIFKTTILIQSSRILCLSKELHYRISLLLEIFLELIAF